MNFILISCVWQASRGRTSPGNYVDEMDFMNPGALETLFPQMVTVGSFFVGITTGNRRGGMTSTIIERRKKLHNEATSSISVVDISGVCAKCQKFMNGSSIWCRHFNMIPTWHDPIREELLKEILPPDVLKREMMNVQTEDATCIFMPRSIDILENGTPVVRMQPCVTAGGSGWFVIAFDPNAGGGNETACVALTKVEAGSGDERFIVLAFDAICLGRTEHAYDDLRVMCLRVLEEARAAAGNPLAIAIVSVEINGNNLISDIMRIYGELKGAGEPVCFFHHPTDVLRSLAGNGLLPWKVAAKATGAAAKRARMLARDPLEGQPGLNLHGIVREEVVNCACYALAEGAFRLAKHAKGSYRPRWGKLVEQAANVRIDPKKGTWSGKINHAGKIVPGQNDDLFVAFAEALYVSTLVSLGVCTNLPTMLRPVQTLFNFS